jgi:hypothetical protein
LREWRRNASEKPGLWKKLRDERWERKCERNVFFRFLWTRSRGRIVVVVVVDDVVVVVVVVCCCCSLRRNVSSLFLVCDLISSIENLGGRMCACNLWIESEV